MDDFLSAIKLLKSGDKLSAQKMFESLLKADPENELLWQWLARAVNDPEEKRECLLEVLRINPDNLSVKIELDQIENSAPQNIPTFSSSKIKSDSKVEEHLLSKKPQNPPPLPTDISVNEEVNSRYPNLEHFCSNCGVRVEGNFCSNCGAPISKKRELNINPVINPHLTVNKTVENERIFVENSFYSKPHEGIKNEPIIVQVPVTSSTRFTTKRTISAIGLGLIIIAGLLSWENTQEWYGLLLGGYHYSASIGLSTGPGVVSTISGIIGLILLFAIKKESNAHFFALLFSAISGITAGIFMTNTGGSVWNRFGFADSISSAGVGLFVVFIGAAISIGSLVIPSNKKNP